MDKAKIILEYQGGTIAESINPMKILMDAAESYLKNYYHETKKPGIHQGVIYVYEYRAVPDKEMFVHVYHTTTGTIVSKGWLQNKPKGPAQ